MTNWPNIQEYRNFEAKFFDNPKNDDVMNSAAAAWNGATDESKKESAIKQESNNEKNHCDDSANGQRTCTSEVRTVRCVIKKDFEETFKKLDRGDGLALSNEGSRTRIQDQVTVDQSAVDKIRLQNHLKWKKQKEEEFLQKKEAERIAQQKKREEEIRMEKAKKLKEKEREEKIREWQEQKKREKEEKKREKMVMKVLENEIKGVMPVVDKERLIEEWVKLKNKQKQMEAEKKAELLKKEEQHRVLRQNLAQLSYRQWKERLKGRMMTLPKNGYQIFGPKPVPVVKEDWNHDFTSNSPRDHIGLHNTRSNTNTSVTFRAGVKELEDLSKDVFYLGEIKSRSPSLYHLKSAKSGLHLTDMSSSTKMPLKELQQGTIHVKNNWSRMLRNDYEETKEVGKNEQVLPGDYQSPLIHLLTAEGDQNRCILTPQRSKTSKSFNDISKTQVLPNKKKIDLYINRRKVNAEENFPVKPPKKQTPKLIEHKEKKEFQNKIRSKEQRSIAPKDSVKMGTQKPERTTSSKNVQKRNGGDVLKKNSGNVKEKVGRRSRSYDKKSFKDREQTKGCSSSKSMIKMNTSVEICRKLTKNKTPTSQKRKSRRKSMPETPESNARTEKNVSESKGRRKAKKKSIALSKSLSFSNSPYCVKKNTSKGKTNRRKSGKDGETKSDGAGHSRKSAITIKV